MSNSLPSINLIKNKQFFPFDKFMDWTLTVGRLIIIITEIIAIAAFVYRFSLDGKLVELHSAVKQKQNMIYLLKNDEDKYRNLQTRIALASTLSAKGARTHQVITDIARLIPNQITIDNLTLNKNRIDMDLNTTSVSSLTDFINPLKDYREIKTISIDSIESKPSIGLSANITALLK